MTPFEITILAVIYLWAMWLLWNGRENSPKRRARDARFQALLEQARKEKR